MKNAPLPSNTRNSAPAPSHLPAMLPETRALRALARTFLACSLSAWALIACGGEGLEGAPVDEAAETSEDALASTERRPKQGPQLTGVIQSRLSHARIRTGSARKADGTPYPSLFVRAGELRSETGTCCPATRLIPSHQAIGTTFLTDDGLYRLRIQGVGAPAGTAVTGSVYRVEYQRTSGSSWSPLCVGVVDGALINEAVPLRGIFDSAYDTWIDDGSRLTFVCRDSAAFKAISWGYAPEIFPLHFQAAVRAARADYCGTGDPYTHPGTEIAVFDLDGIRADPGPADGLQFEAAWLPDGQDEIPNHLGAMCLSKRRWDTLAPTTPRPGTAACTSLPLTGEFQQVCAPGSYADAPGRYPEPSAANLAAMRAEGARVFTRSRNMR